MFNFTTQTIYNQVIKVADSAIKNGTATKGYNIITGTDPNKPEVRIGNTRFNKEDVLDIHKATHLPENLATTTIDIEQLIGLVNTAVSSGEAGAEPAAPESVAGNYRIVFYIGLIMNSQDAAYSNAYVYKGKPLFVEFQIKKDDEDPEVIAARIKKIVDKYLLFIAGEKLLNVTVDGAEVTFTAVNGYQQFKQVLVQKYDPNAGNSYDCCSATGDFVTIMTGVPVMYKLDSGVVTSEEKVLDETGEGRELNDDEFEILPGTEAFLDYNWIIHNLRLPTLANTNFWSPTVQAKEMPVVGGQYNQYIVRLCKERDGIAGHVVGHRATSVTTHVFYVLDDGGSNITNFEAALNIIKPDGGSIEAKADEVAKDPYAIGD